MRLSVLRSDLGPFSVSSLTMFSGGGVLHSMSRGCLDTVSAGMSINMPTDSPVHTIPLAKVAPFLQHNLDMK